MVTKHAARRHGVAEKIASDALTHAIVENALDSVSVIDADGTYRFVSPSNEALTGYTVSDLIGRNALDFVHPQDLARIRAAIADDAVEPGRTITATYRFLHRRGTWITFEASGKNLLDDPAVRGIVITARDVSARAEEERAKAILRELDRRILAATPLDELLAFVCGRIAEHFDLGLVWIGAKMPDGSIEIRAKGGPAVRYLDGILVRWDDTPEGQGPSGRVLRSGKAMITVFDRAEFFAPWRARARENALASSAVIPLGNEGNIFGVLNLYAPQTRAFTEDMLTRLTEFADQIAISMVHAEHQERIRLETAALEAAAIAIFITDRRGTIEWVNTAFTQTTGYASDEAVGKYANLLKSGTHERAFYRRMWETVLSGDTWRGEVRNRRKDGSTYISEEEITPVRDRSGSITHFVSTQQDISERKRQEESIVHLATHDPLTDLPNRRAMDEGLLRAIQRAERDEQSALLLLDIDNFKSINDSVGHPAGDRFLVQLGPVLASVLRPGDLLARFGGDEFGILLERASRELAHSVAERLRDAASEVRFQEGGYTFSPTISVGVALIDGKTGHPAGVVSLADAALHAAKEAGKNRVVVYQSLTEREARFTEASQWVVRLRDALRDDRFELFYQPIVALASGDVERHEALIRLRERDGSIVPPGAFIPAAERFGLATMIDEWVIRRAITDGEEHSDLNASINVSAASLGDEGLLGRIAELFARAQFPPGRITLEITESAAVQDLVHAQRWIERLSACNCGFALDDFGMGFSSFSYLRALPVVHVKIDGSFVAKLSADASTRAVVQAMIDVAHALGKKVVAEQVHDQRTMSLLRRMGAEWGQGYFLGEPAPLQATAV